MPQATGYSLELERAAPSGPKEAVDPLFSMQWNMEALTVLGLWSRHVVEGVARIRVEAYSHSSHFMSLGCDRKQYVFILLAHLDDKPLLLLYGF